MCPTHTLSGQEPQGLGNTPPAISAGGRRKREFQIISCIQIRDNAEN